MNAQQQQLNNLGANIINNYSIGDVIEFSNATYTIIGIMVQTDSYNVGRIILKKSRSSNLHTAWVRKSGALSPASIERKMSGNWKIKELADYVKYLGSHGAVKVGWMEVI
jgi:hypothetical protein